MNGKKLFRSWITGVAALLLFAGCENDDATVNPVPVATGNVLVVHASPDAPSVDLLVNNTVVASGLSFPNNTGYLATPAGTPNVKVRVAGTTTTVIDANLPVVANRNYTVFAADSVAELKPVVLTDDLTPPASGKAHVRFVHLSPNAPAVDVALQGGAVVFANTAFTENTAFTPLDAGTYDLEVRVAGQSTVVLPLPGISLQAGKIYTVFARGFVGGSNEEALGAQIILNN